LQVGELAMESTGGHRLLSFQVEGQVLRGSDHEADTIAAFALDLFAAMDGRVVVATTGPKASAGRQPRKAASPGARMKPIVPAQLPPPAER
jgi:hypothetical protein